MDRNYWLEYERRKKALPEMPPDEYEAAIKNIDQAMREYFKEMAGKL